MKQNRIFAPEFAEYYHKHPLVLVDVGASGGLGSHWLPAQTYLQVVGFEPDQRAFLDLKKKEGDGKKVKYLNTALYREKASLVLYLAAKQEVSSIFRPNKEWLRKFPEVERFDIVGSTKIETDTLDNQFRVNNIKDADFIKIDTQGSELFILQGATETVSNCVVFGLEVEVEFTEMYQNQPLFSDVNCFIRKQGFDLFDVRTCHWKRSSGVNYGKSRGQLIFGDTLYLRRSENFTNALTKIADDFERRAKALKAISICFLYGYFDYALEVAEMTHRFFTESESGVLEKWIKKNTGGYRRIPDFKGKGRIADLYRALWGLFRPTYNGWAAFERKLGNLD